MPGTVKFCRGNVVAPDDLVDHYGTDTVRTFLMFFARWEQGGPWNSRGLEGAARWLKRVWCLFNEEVEDGAGGAAVERNLRRKVHQTVRQVTSDFERFQFNTLIAALMELLNEMVQARTDGAVGTDAWREAQDIYLRLLAPVAPTTRRRKSSPWRPRVPVASPTAKRSRR